MQISRIKTYSLTPKNTFASLTKTSQPFVERSSNKNKEDDKKKKTKLTVATFLALLLLLLLIYKKKTKNSTQNEIVTNPNKQNGQNISSGTNNDFRPPNNPDPSIESSILLNRDNAPPPPPPSGSAPPMSTSGNTMLGNLTDELKGILTEFKTLVNYRPKHHPTNKKELEESLQIVQRRNNLGELLRINNVSIMNKKEFENNSLETIAEKIVYLDNISKDIYFNNATGLDIVNEYSKYAQPCWYNQNTKQSYLKQMAEICEKVDNSGANESSEIFVIKTFLDVAEKIANKENIEMLDSSVVNSFMIGKIKNKELALRYIELMKKISIDKSEKNTVIQNTIQFSEDLEVKKALSEYDKILSQQP